MPELAASGSRADLVLRIDALAAGVRGAQRQRDEQRRAGRLRGIVLLEDLRAQRGELAALRQRLQQGGAAIFAEFSEGCQELAALAAAQQAAAVEEAHADSFSLFLCSQKHTAQELNACAETTERVRLDLKAVEELTVGARSQHERDCESVLAAVGTFSRKCAEEKEKKRKVTPDLLDSCSPCQRRSRF
jgi:xanthine/CO dehydrogenase XdhC/CoxF family maturation factor